MIEVEKKFQPTEEQLSLLLRGAEFLGEEENIDYWYDTPDFFYFPRGIKLRQRNGEYELKVKIQGSDAEATQQNEEITDQAVILKRLGLEAFADLPAAVAGKMHVYGIITLKRKKYKKEGFSIDVDETDFGYDMCEIELLVETESEIAAAGQKILMFADRHGFDAKDLPSKIGEYLRRIKPDVYKKLYNKST